MGPAAPPSGRSPTCCATLYPPPMAATDTLRAEYEALTERCGLVDRSERGKLALTGAGAVEFLNGQVTNELTGLRPGEGRYAAFLTNKGKMLGDLRILAVGGRGRGDSIRTGHPPNYCSTPSAWRYRPCST